jgi:hypothetical protein
LLTTLPSSGRALELVNQSRQEHDLPPLAPEGRLNESAQAHADDMFTRHRRSHRRRKIQRFARPRGIAPRRSDLHNLGMESAPFLIFSRGLSAAGCGRICAANLCNWASYF